MTPVGHSICGLTIAAIAIPRECRWKKALLTAGSFILLANAPDIPFPGWGHDRYDISHSLIVTAALTGLLYILFKKTTMISHRYLIAGGGCWFSHILLDSTYNHGKGLRVWWPISEERLAMPLPWFETLRSPINYLSEHSVRVMSIELVAFGIIFAIAMAFRFLTPRRLGRG